MPQFESGVNAPAGGRYLGPLVDFGALANWGPDDPRRLRQEQEARAFQQGLPIDPQTGQTDFKSVAATALKYGDFPLLERLAPFLQQQDMNRPSPFFGGGGQPQAAAPAYGAPAAVTPPAPAAAAPAPPRVGGLTGSLLDMVSSVLPQGAQDTVQRVATNIGRALRIAPDAPIPAEQQERAQQYVAGYAQRNGGAVPVTGDAIDNYGRMIKKRESGSAEGDYRAEGPIITNRNSPYYGDRAYGAYQVMGRNIPEWTREVLGQPLTIEQFVNSKEAQDAVFRAKFGQYIAKTGSPRDAASMWFSGLPFSQGQAKSDYQPGQKGGTTGAKYAGDFPPTTGGAALASSGVPAAASAAPTAAPSAPGQAPWVDATGAIGNVGRLTPDALVRSVRSARVTEVEARQRDTQAATPSGRIEEAFSALPPSAGAGVPSQSATRGDRQTAQPEQQPPQPLVPPAPLPVDPSTGQLYTDWRKAYADLENYARRIAPTNPQQAKLHMDAAKEILESYGPFKMGQYDRYIDPQHPNQVIAEGPGAAALSAAPNSPSLDIDAERYFQAGTFPPGTGRGVQGQAYSRAIEARAAQLHPDVPASEWPQRWQRFKAQQVGIQRFTSTGPEARSIRSFNVLVDHLGTLSEAAAALNNGNIQLFNSLRQTWAAQTGGTAPTDFDGVKALVGDEIVKAVVGSAGALADREEVKKDLDRIRSPEQLGSLVDKYRKLALGQLRGLKKGYEVATGLKNFDDMLLPGTREFFDRESSGGSSSGATSTSGRSAPPANVSRVSSKAEYDALPSGSPFITPDGKSWQKP